MKYTKGDWNPFSYHNLEEEVEYGVSSSNGKYIGEEMTEGDAHLIASAPEMLGLLKTLKKTLKRYEGDRLPNPIQRLMIADLGGTIAKAEGEQS